MCGIVGLFLKDARLEAKLGAYLAPMLIGMSERGPDSAGFAIYRPPAAGCTVKLTLHHPDERYPWQRLRKELATALSARVEAEVRASHCVLASDAEGDAIRRALAERHPEVRLMGIGETIEIFKEKGLPEAVAERFRLAELRGSHAIGHTRMATESAVTTEHSHPFSTGLDLCLVHNGSLSNHNRLRLWLRRHGIEFQTDNDTEVAAGYLTWRLREGASLDQALEAALVDLDGFYTFAVGTKDGFAVLRDAFACKPAVLAETDDWVAMASEYRSIAHLPGAEAAKIWEPAPGDGLQLGAALNVITVDLENTSVRELNRTLHALPADTNERLWRVVNPRGAHAVAAGLTRPIEVTIEGHVGYYCAGMNQAACLTIHGHAGRASPRTSCPGWCGSPATPRRRPAPRATAAWW